MGACGSDTESSDAPQGSETPASAPIARSGPTIDSQPVSGDVKTWIAHACQSGTYIDHNPSFNWASGGGQCRAKGSASLAHIDLLFGVFPSPSAWQQESALRPNSHVAEAFLEDGSVFVALSMSSSRPLDTFSTYGMETRQL